MLVALITFCSSCKIRRKNEQTHNESKSLKNITGVDLEKRINDEVSLQLKTTPRICLSNMDISNLTKQMFEKFTGIYAIDLSSNGIEEIENETFAKNAKLEKINLMENNLRKVSKHLLTGEYSDLQEIDFSYNVIASIDAGSFDKVLQLETIDLSFNCLKHLHSDLFKKNPELRQVLLRENEIFRISSEIFNSKADLKVLDLSKNELETVPEFLTKKIKHFDLSFNRLTILDLNYDSNEKKKCASISELVLSFNLISNCVESSDRRTDIVHLDLSHNAIESMDDFPSFLNLEVLILAKNNISDLSLHNFEDRFPSLKIFNIYDNPISCEDFRYIRNHLQSSLVVATDSNLAHRCHRNNSEVDEFFEDEYEDSIVKEIRIYNHKIIDILKVNQSFLVVILLAFSSCLLVFVVVLVRFYLKKLAKPTKKSLLEEIEL